MTLKHECFTLKMESKGGKLINKCINKIERRKEFKINKENSAIFITKKRTVGRERKKNSKEEWWREEEMNEKRETERKWKIGEKQTQQKNETEWMQKQEN